MEEMKTAGGKQFVFVLLWAAVLYLICAMIMSAFGQYAFIGGIIAVVVFCIFGFFVLTRYTARFTYLAKNGRVRITRAIGKRIKEVEIDCKDIISTSYGCKPTNAKKPITYMRVSIFSDKNSLFIEYKNEACEKLWVVIEPTKKLIKRIDRERKKADDS